MVNDLYTIPSETDTKQVVLSFLNAVNNEDFKAARRYVTNDMKFNGVLGSRDGAEDYFEGMEKLKFKFDVKKVFVDDNDVCVFYDVDMSGVKVFCCGWYQLKDDKINYIRVVFDPRPVLDR